MPTTLQIDEEIALLSRKKSVMKAREDFASWCRLCGYEPARHHMLIIDKLQAAVEGKTTKKKLLILMPPGTAKSTYTSILFIPWYLGKCPDNCIIACSHALELAEDFGRKSRNLVSSYANILGYQLMADSKAASKWETTQGGEYRCFGVGAGLAGRRADLGLIDDPIGSQEDADSKAVRDRQWGWYLMDFLPRLKPGAIQVLICNRRHEQDLAGMLLDREPDEWMVISAPFYATEGDCLGRLPGQTIWPEYFDASITSSVEKLRRKNPRLFSGLYQQHPTPEDGDYFKIEHIQGYEPQDLPNLSQLRIYAASDHAVSKKEDANKTCMVFAGVDAGGDIYVLPDIFWQRANSEEQVNAMLYYNKRYKPIYWRAEKGHISMSFGPFLRRRMREERNYLNLHEVVAKRDKPTRARSFQGLTANRRIFFPKFATWWGDAEHQLLAFPHSNEDDFVDAMAHLGNEIDNMTNPEEYVSIDEDFSIEQVLTFADVKNAQRRQERLAMQD